MNTYYTKSFFEYQRRKTREVKVGDVGVGASNPIRIQSMTISDTKNTEAVVAETIGLANAGCEIVRITAPTVHHAENLKNIRDRLRQEGIHVPLVADIHFTPQAAMIAADYVDKIRINPGNYADRKLFAVKDYSDQEYESELQRMAEKFIPLVKKLKKNGVALRIGTNHGSLSDRIMNRYGDTPEGMVESALEFAKICEAESYQDIIFSMKASSPFIMIAAYRLLVQRMNDLGMDYPLHLGVTEAGEGEDGRIKSALGIGALLEDGIGDTIRVSLTEDSIHEIPVASQLVKKFNQRENISKGLGQASQVLVPSWETIQRVRRFSHEVNLGNSLVGATHQYGIAVRVNADKVNEVFNYYDSLKEDALSPDFLFFEENKKINDSDLIKLREKVEGRSQLIKSVSAQGFQNEMKEVLEVQCEGTTQWNELKTLLNSKSSRILTFSSAEIAINLLKNIDSNEISSCAISLNNPSVLYEYRKLASELSQLDLNNPIHIKVDAKNFENPQLEVSSALGALLMDGIGDSIEIAGLPIEESTQLAFNILQASRLRITKAEFIACPSCGRTLFDLQETTQRIKTKTSHLKGVKIAIMGCIVNGPGEMADADFGYVGGGPGKIHLYVGKDCVEKNIPSAVADEKLIELIKKHDRWIDPPAA